MRGKEPAHLKPFEIVRLSERTVLCGNPDDPASWKVIRQRGRRWVNRHRGLLPAADVDDVVANAVNENYPVILCPAVELDEVNSRLKTSLSAHRRRQSRQSLKEVAFEEQKVQRPSFQAPVRSESVELLGRIARKLDSLFQSALEGLRDRDYTVLFNEYKLHEIGMAARLSPPPVFSSNAARRKSRQRARERFYEKLENLLREGADPSSAGDLEAVTAAIHELRDGHNVDWIEFMAGFRALKPAS